METEHVKTSIRVNKQLYSGQSEYQRIDVFETQELGKMIVLDGEIIFSEADEFIYNEMVVHVPMAVHPCVKQVLIIGGGDGGVARVLTQYPEIEHIDVVEQDEKFVEISKEFFPETAKGFDDERVTVTNMDGLRFLRRCRDKYDLIINDTTDPFGYAEGLFTREFYGICYNALRSDGIMVNQQGSPFYKHDAEAMQRSHKRIVNTFPISRVYQAHIPTYAAGYWLFGFASKNYHPINDFDEERWKSLHLSTKYYTTKLHIGSFYLPAYLEKMLMEVES